MDFEKTEEKLNYKIFLSSTFLDLKELRQNIINALSQAGLFFFAMEMGSADRRELKDKLRSEINESDIFVLLVKESLGSTDIEGTPITQFEFKHAKKVGVPILPYFTDQGEYNKFSSDTKEFKTNVSKVAKYSNIKDNNLHTSINIISDILNYINLNKNINGWVRSDMSSAEITSIIKRNNEFNNNISASRGLIYRLYYELSDSERKNNIFGQLIDCGLFLNTSSRSHKFAKVNTNLNEITRKEMKFEYCIDRFAKYENHDCIYDKKLDLSWFVIQDQTFTFDEAIHWKDNIESKNLRKIGDISSIDKNGQKHTKWRLPKIEELVTLITYDEGSNGYIDDKIFCTDARWFWSSTMASTDRYFYIETIHGQALIDDITGNAGPRYKGLILCIPGKVEKELKKFIFSPNDKLIKNKTIGYDTFKRIHKVYLTSLATTLINDENLSAIYRLMSTNDYFITIFENIGSRSFAMRETVLNEMMQCDYYLFICDYDALSCSEELSKRAIIEVNVAKELGLPIAIIHNVPVKNFKSICKKYDLENFGVAGVVKSASHMSAEILTTLSKLAKETPKPGWIKRTFFNAINKSINDINSVEQKLENYEKYVIELLEVSNRNHLRSDFENFGILKKPPQFGEATKFVSQNAPIERLQVEDFITSRKNLNVLFINMENRFQPISKNNEFVYDNYLNLEWYTKPQKQLSYSEAINHVTTFSKQQKEKWRLPTIHELKTLITQKRGKRKYMDEMVFPTSRWFWTSTVENEYAYFLDFNYPIIAKEQISDNIQKMNTKSVLLVKEK